MSQDGKWTTCCRQNCGTTFWLPKPLDDVASADRGPGGTQFYCPYGHGQHYRIGESDADKLRRERDLLAQRIAMRDEEIAGLRERRQQTERQLAATKGVVTRIKNRIGAGVCPCCTRSFSDLHRHMKSKHPAYRQDEVAA